MKINILLLFIYAMATSCAYSVHQVQAGDFNFSVRPSKARTVSASSEQFVIMGFADNVDYVDSAVSKLKRKCSNSISGITTEYMTELGFFSWRNKIYLKGKCVK